MKTLLLFLFASGFRITTGRVTVVQTCPKTKTAWDHRSSIFTCEDGNNKYHCVMTSMLNLVEVCITPLNVSGNEKGCPLVYIFESAAFWEFPFTSCPAQNTECPQDGHGGYTSEQLYKYPSCFRNISERISGDNNVTQTTTGTRVSTSNILQEEARKPDLEYLPYTIAAVFLLLGSIHVLILLMYWKIRIRFKEVEVKIEEGSKRSSQISSLSSDTLLDYKGSDEIPLSVSYSKARIRKTQQNSYVPYRGKKDVKVNYDHPLPVSDSRKGTSSTSNYESPVKKDMKGNDATPLPDSDTTNYANYPVGKDMKGNDVTTLPDSDTTDYANCPVEKDMKGKDVTPLPDSDTTNYANYPVGKDVKVNDDPPLPVSVSRKGTSRTANYERPVEKDVKVNDDPPLPVSVSRKGTSRTANYERPVEKERTEQK